MTTCFGKSCSFCFSASAFRKLSSIYVFSYFPFGFEGRIWDLIVSVPEHCLSFYLNSGQLIFKYVFSKICHYNRSCNQQNYIILEVVTRPFSKKCKMSNKD